MTQTRPLNDKKKMRTRREDEYAGTWIVVAIIVVFVIVVTAVFLAAEADRPEPEHRRHRGDDDDTQRWCRVNSTSCETDGFDILYTWIVNCSNELGVIVDTRPSDLATCPDVTHPVDSIDRCWRLHGVDRHFSWTRIVPDIGHRDRDRDREEPAAWTGFGIFLLILFMICIPLACVAMYWHENFEKQSPH